MNRFNVMGSIAMVALLALGGCARDISSGTYKASHVGEASTTYAGVINSMREVQVEEGEYLEQNRTGAALGAIAGGVGGYQFGKGRGNVAATAAGALLGGVAGAYAEKNLKSQRGMEYTVKLNNGQMMTVVQAIEPRLSMGQRVLVIVGQAGRSRIVPN